MMQSDVRARLCDALRDSTAGSMSYCYYLDHDGDGETGSVVYNCGGDIMQAPYSIGEVNGKATCSIDTENAVDVVPVMTYQPEADDEDHYTAMESERLYAAVPVYERFISKDTRKAASSDSFAGKGRSFPILKAEDVSAALHSIGRAGPGNYSSDVIRANIKRIAKAKGFALPDSLKSEAERGNASNRSGDNLGTSDGLSVAETVAGVRQALESGRDGAVQAFLDSITVEKRGTVQTMELRECAATCGEIVMLREASGAATIPIKLIAPGEGTSAHYPVEVLKRDGPKAFPAKTHVYANHPTAAEEAARPEGNVDNLAGVLTRDAEWRESFIYKDKDMGPGLYSDVKPFSDHAVLFNEKGEFLGMSIRAHGIAEAGKKRNGKPILKQLTHAESVDVVTRAGAGGMILVESARGATTQQEVNMTDAEVKVLVENAVTSAVTTAIAAVQKPVSLLEARALRGDAVVLANRHLSTMRGLPDASKSRVVEAAIRDLPMKDGALDEAKFGELVLAEAKKEAQYVAQLTGAGNIAGMGPSGPAETDPVKLAEARKRQREEDEAFALEEARTFASLTGIRLVEKEVA